MRSARKQAENYARALDEWPPFLLVVDVGHVIELYADFSGQGKNYAHFPDRQTYRIGMDDLRDEKVQALLRAIWTDPRSLNPTRISAEVTRDIAERLAKIAKRLMKMGNTCSPWRYDVGACSSLQSARMRCPTTSHRALGGTSDQPSVAYLAGR